MRIGRIAPINPPAVASGQSAPPARAPTPASDEGLGAVDADAAAERAAYRWLSVVSYRRLFEADTPDLWPDSARLDESSPRQRIRTLSRDNVTRLERNLRALSCDEKTFLQRFVDADLFAVHFTRKPLVRATLARRSAPPAALRFYSSRNLIARNIDFTGGSGEAERDLVGNGDFVFFSIEVGAQPKKLESRFGEVRYRFRVDEHPMLREDAWLSMDDMLLDSLDSPDTAVDRPSRLVLPSLEPCDRQPDEGAPSGRTSAYAFFGPDIRRGMALSLIERIRLLDAKESRIRVLSAASDEELNGVLNGFFRPELKSPRAFIGTPFPDPA